MPISPQALILLRTYTSEAGLWPTRTTARPGRRERFAMRGRRRARISLRTAVPSRICAIQSECNKHDPGPCQIGETAVLLIPGIRMGGAALPGQVEEQHSGLAARVVLASGQARDVRVEPARCIWRR